jgi:hypothetical protein
VRTPLRLVLLSRPGCHLCEEFADDLRAWDASVPLDIADVDSRREWREEFGRRIPVLLDGDGKVIGEGKFDPDRLA